MNSLSSELARFCLAERSFWWAKSSRMLCRVNWQKVVGLSEECNASIFRVKQSENSDFCFPQFSRFYNRLNIQQLYNIIQGVYCPQHGTIIAQKARIRRHISWKLLCSGTRYSEVIPIILTGAPPAWPAEQLIACITMFPPGTISVQCS